MTSDKLPLKSDHLIVIHQNVRGLLSKVGEIEILLDLYSPSILCLSEHFLCQTELDTLHMPGYTVAASYCRSNIKMGGVLILTGDQVNYSEIDVSDFCRERVCELAAIKVKHHLLTTVFICVYRSPSKNMDKFLEFLNCVRSCIESLRNNNYTFLIAGDFNVDLSVKSSRPAKLLVDLMSSFGLRDTIVSFTREFQGSRSTIDNIFTDLSQELFTSSVLVTGISDHHAQIGKLTRITPNTNRLTSRMCRSFDPNNTCAFKYFLRKECWSNLILESCIDNKFDSFFSTIAYYTNLAFPLKNTKVKENKPVTKIFLDNELKKLREKMLFLYSLSKDLDSFHPIKQTYLKTKKEFKNHINSRKADLVLNKMAVSSNMQRTVWSIVNDLRPNKSRKPFNQTSVLDSEGRLVHSPELVANTLNNFFASVRERLKNDCNTPLQSLHIQGESIQPSLFLAPTNEREVVEVIKSLKLGYSSGNDEISSKLLKECADEFAAPIAYLANCSFETGTFPTVLKQSKIRPMLKNKGNQHDCNNYRPIAILSTFSKVIEKLFLIRLNRFLHANNVLHGNQFGFRSGTSTLNAVYSLVTEISNSLDVKCHVSGLFLDLCKAFDVVDHSLLLAKLEILGIRGVSLNWISSYLSLRTQVVEIPYLDSSGGLCKQLSEKRLVRSGVPQGSVLGPVLFLLFINDFPSIVQDSRLYLFADDTSLVVSNVDRSQLEIQTYIQSNCIAQWLSDNGLYINTKKTSFLEFCLRKSTCTSDSLTLLFDETDLSPTSCVTYLGVVLDNKLNFYNHIDKLHSRLSSSIFLLRRLSCFHDKHILLAAYYGCFYPFLTYCVPIWGNENCKSKSLFKLQKRAIRIIFGLNPRQTCQSVFRTNNLLTFPSIFILESLTFLKKYPHLFSVNNLSSHTYNLRRRNNPPNPRSRTTFHQNQSHSTCIRLFRSLPSSLKSQKNVRKFRHGLRRYLVDGEFYSVADFLNSGP